jgi:hypothetical protein
MRLSHRLPCTAHALTKSTCVFSPSAGHISIHPRLQNDTVPLVIAMKLQASYVSRAADTAGFHTTLLTERNTIHIEKMTVA